MGIFQKIFGSKDPIKKGSPTFVNPVHVELHSHLIPGVDDGVETLEQSMEIIRAMAELGMKKIITTPHIMSDFYKNGADNLRPLAETVNEAILAEGLDITFEVAAEYLIDDEFEKKIEAGNMMTFGSDKKYILVELPFLNEPRNFKQSIFNLQIAGYKPILAHPERYPYFDADKKRFHELHDQGLLFQLNMLSCIGHYSKPVADAANYLVDHKLVDMVGSDTHNIRHLDLWKHVFASRTYQMACELELLNNNL